MTDSTPTPGGIAAAVKQALRDARVSDAAAAEALGIQRQTLNRRLNGHHPLTSADLVGIAHLLGVSVRDLVAPAERGNGSAA